MVGCGKKPRISDDLNLVFSGFVIFCVNSVSVNSTGYDLDSLTGVSLTADLLDLICTLSDLCVYFYSKDK